MSAPVHWTQIPPATATRLALPDPDIVGPTNEMGEPCPWPWEPQQLLNAPLGQYHCRYCDAMVIAGIPHPDYSDQPEFLTDDAMTSSITCPKCGMTSRNPHDVREGYCANCHDYTSGSSAEPWWAPPKD